MKLHYKCKITEYYYTTTIVAITTVKTNLQAHASTSRCVWSPSSSLRRVRTITAVHLIWDTFEMSTIKACLKINKLMSSFGRSCFFKLYSRVSKTTFYLQFLMAETV